MTKQELVKFLIDNFTNQYGNLDLSNLDFSDFNGYVDISNMKVKDSLLQNHQKVNGNLWQDEQEVKGNLHQDGQKVDGDCLSQHHQKVGGDLHQNCQQVGGNLWQDHQKVKGTLFEQKTIVLDGKEYKVDLNDNLYGGVVEEHTEMGLTFKTLIDTFGKTLYLVSNGNFSYHSNKSFEDAVQGLKRNNKA